jgi:YbbR domain-containing protein
VAVYARTEGNPSPGHYLTGIIVTPLTVIATGPRDLLNSLDFVYTTPVVLSGGSGNYTVTATLEAPPGVTLSATKVTVEIETGSVPPPPTPTPSPPPSPSPT